MERTSAARKRLNATARRSAAVSACSPWAAPSASSALQLGAQAGVDDRGRTHQKRFGVLTESAELVFGRGFRPWSAAGRGSGPVVVLVEDRRLAGRDELMFGHDRPGGRLDDQERPMVDDEVDADLDHPGRYRMTVRDIPDARNPVDLAAAPTQR